MSDTHSFHHWLKKRRKALDLTYDELAHRVGCSPITLRKLESGERRPSAQLAERLADQLQIEAPDRARFLMFARTGLPDLALAALPATAPALPEEAPDFAPLPRPLTRIIGREQELAQIRAFLLEANMPLVTLLGPAGVGKTRLSLEIASAMQPAFPDGVVFVELAAVHQPHMVLPAIAQAIGLKHAADLPVDVALRHALRDRRMLLVLDNFEQVTGASPGVAALLAACPQLQVLATSRVPLGIRGEQQLPIAPLALPDLARLPAPHVLKEIPAVRLFVERVCSAVPQFRLTEADSAAVATICSRLDGLPLAIELVAARCTLLPPQALLARLMTMRQTPSLDLLTGGASDLPARHQTLRDAISWSYRLLRPAEQRLFERLGCFVGSWTLEAAEGVCGEAAADDKPGGASMLDQMGVLLNSSLVRVVAAGETGPRFGMLEIMREYALERLAARGELETMRQRHARYYLACAEATWPDMRRAAQMAHFAALERERTNLQIALEWLTEQEPHEGLRMAVALWWFWYLRGYWVEGRTWLHRALDSVPDAPASPMLAYAWLAAGSFAWVLGDYTEACSRCEQSLAVWRANGDQRGLAYSLMFLGMAKLRQRQPAEAQQLLEESVAHFRHVGDIWGLAHTLNALRQLLVATGDLATARKHQQESVDLWRMSGDSWGLALALNGLGEITRSEGQYAAAVPLYEESLALFRAADDKGNTAMLLHNLAHAVLHCGSPQHAAALFAEGLRLDYSQGNVQLLLKHIAGLGAVAVACGAHRYAARVLGYIHAHFESKGSSLWPIDQDEYDRVLARLLPLLATPALHAAWQQGRAMSLEQAVASALELDMIRPD